MRRCREIVVSVLLLGSLPLATVGAQPLSELAPGARVRIRAPGIVAGRYTGTVLSRTADTLVVASSAAAAARVPVSSLTSVEVSRGKSRSRGVLKGIAWGAPIGLVVGLLAAAALSSDPDYGGLEETSKGEFVAQSFAGGAIWGAIIGAIAGSERWDRYDLPTRTSLWRPITPGGGARLGVRVAVGR
jgi:hypothetical protein